MKAKKSTSTLPTMDQKGLQKLTESKRTFEQLYNQEAITIDEVRALPKIEKGRFWAIVEVGDSRSVNLFTKAPWLFEATDQDTRNRVWESNQIKITYAIYEHIRQYNCMATIGNISENTGLSRQTVHKHLKDINSHPLLNQETEMFKFMSAKVVAKLFNLSMQGDVKAAKVYLNAVGGLYGRDTSAAKIETQNNYIQINGITLTHEAIKNLPPDQLTAIESILKTALPQLLNNNNASEK